MDADPDPPPPAPHTAAASGKRPLYESDEEGECSTPTAPVLPTSSQSRRKPCCAARTETCFRRMKICSDWNPYGLGLGGRACEYTKRA